MSFGILGKVPRLPNCGVMLLYVKTVGKAYHDVNYRGSNATISGCLVGQTGLTWCQLGV